MRAGLLCHLGGSQADVHASEPMRVHGAGYADALRMNGASWASWRPSFLGSRIWSSWRVAELGQCRYRAAADIGAMGSRRRRRAEPRGGRCRGAQQRASELGALGGTRTPNLLIRSQMLYPLSYER